MSTYIHRTDRCVNEELRVYRSLQSFTGIPKHCIQGKRAQAIVELALPILATMLSIPPNIKIRLASMKGRFTGRYSHFTNTVLVDYMRKDRSILETLAHELVHAEQYFTGRLVNVQLPHRRQWRFEWRGELTSKGSTYKSYRNQPHEVEAFERAPVLAAAVIKKLGC